MAAGTAGTRDENILNVAQQMDALVAGIGGTSDTATRSNVTAAVADTSLLVANAARKGGLFFNDSTAILYLAYGATAASTTSYSLQVPANGFFEMPSPVYRGAIRGIWSAANGAARITEMT